MTRFFQFPFTKSTHKVWSARGYVSKHSLKVPGTEIETRPIWLVSMLLTTHSLLCLIFLNPEIL